MKLRGLCCVLTGTSFFLILVEVCRLKVPFLSRSSSLDLFPNSNLDLAVEESSWVWVRWLLALLSKVEKILKGSLDSSSSPSPSVKIQIMGRKVCLRGKGKTLLGIVNKLLSSKVCWQHPAMFCLYTFPAHNLNFHWRWRWWDRIQATF